jgi:TonB-linked SusC/RagA family outer membrane protein
MNQKFKAVLLLFLVPFFAFAQSVITGTVLESNGLPALGATVSVKGTSNGTSTDFDGKYTLNNVPKDAVIVFSFIGYTTQEIPYTGQTEINTTLEENPSELDTIVLIGYGSIKKANVTSAQTTVKDEEFNRGAITSPGELIAGKVAGVQVTAASGRPGDGPTIRVRPGSTLGGNQDALYVVDGVPLDQRNASLNSINPADIESFTILKDASATAIYGNRASNGVVLITTKKAKMNSDLKLGYDFQLAINQVQNYAQVLTGDQFRQLIADQGKDPSVLGTANTDWQNEIYQNGTRAIHNFTAEKGYENTSIRASLGYTNEHGTLLKSGYERATLGLNLRQNFLKGDLKLTFTSQLAQEEIRRADEGAVGSAVIFDPTQSIFDTTGAFGGFFEYTNSTGPEGNAPRNPLGLLNSLDSELDNQQARMNLNVAYDIRQVIGLKFTGNAGIDYNEFDSFSIRDLNSGAGARGNNKNFDEGFRRNQLLDGRFDYKRTLTSVDTDIDLTLGGSYQDFLRQSTGRSSVNNNLQENLAAIDASTLITAFARASFDIKDLIVLSGSASRNGSSRFSKNNRWANFYGVSGALKFTNTDFIQNSGFVSQLKLRGGFGQTGQQDIDASFPFIRVFTPGQPQAAVQFGDQFITTIRPEGTTDPKWETTDQWNAGIDLGFFNDRITGSVDAFYRETFDVLQFSPLPAGGLENAGWQNAGSTLSRGIESSISIKIIQSENMNWTLSANARY